MLMLNGVNVDFQRQFRAACGYAELGMTTESIAELNVIDDEHQGRPEVLQLRLHHLMRKKQWTRALTISRRLCRAAPQASAGYSACWFLFAPDRQNQGGKGNVATRTDGAAEGTDLLLQHGLLRSFARQPERCPGAFAD